MKFSIKPFKLILSFLIIILFISKSSKKYLKIIPFKSTSPTNTITCNFLGLSFIVFKEGIDYYFGNNPLIFIKPSKIIILMFLEFFEILRENAQDSSIYKFFYLMFYDLFIGFFIFKMFRGNICYGLLKILLRVVEIIIDITVFWNQKNSKNQDLSPDGTSRLEDSKNELFFDLIIILDVIYLFLNYKENKKPKYGMIYPPNLEESEDTGEDDLKPLPKDSSKDEDQIENNINSDNNKNNWGDSKM